MKILVLALGSYKVRDTTGVDPENVDRQTLYGIALHELIRIKPEGAGIVVAENTLESIDQVVPALREQLQSPAVHKVVLVKNNQFGVMNKGAGEYIMCRAAIAECGDFIRQHDWVIYFTSRYPIPFPALFEYIAKNYDKEAIVANATYLYPDGKEVSGVPGNFNDVIFAMRTNRFLDYVNSMEPEQLVAKKMNSEQNLYNFVTGSGMSYQEVYRLGVFRYNYVTFQMEVI